MKSFVNFPAVSDCKNQYGYQSIIHTVNNPVVSHPHTVTVNAPHHLLAPRRTGIFSQPIDGLKNPPEKRCIPQFRKKFLRLPICRNLIKTHGFCDSAKIRCFASSQGTKSPLASAVSAAALSSMSSSIPSIWERNSASSEGLNSRTFSNISFEIMN